MSTRSDEDLVAALRGGNEEAFAALVEEWGPTLLRLARLHAPSRAVAEEVVQETWVGVLRGLDRFEGRSSFKTWVFQILLNTARTRSRRESRTLPFSFFRRRAEEGGAEPAVEPERFLPPSHPERPGWWALPPAPWTVPDERLVTREMSTSILEAIADLPPRQREVITMRDVEGYPADEVCHVLDLSETNQRVLLHRARSTVRTAVEEQLGSLQ